MAAPKSFSESKIYFLGLQKKDDPRIPKDLYEYAEYTHLQGYFSPDKYGDSKFTSGERQYFVGIYSGKNRYLTIMAKNLEMDPDKNIHNGYDVLNFKFSTHFSDALKNAAKFIEEITNSKNDEPDIPYGP